MKRILLGSIILIIILIMIIGFLSCKYKNEEMGLTSEFVADKNHPIVVLYPNSAMATLLGGSNSNTWFPLSDFIATQNGKNGILLKGGETFNFYSGNKYITQKSSRDWEIRVSEASNTTELLTSFNSLGENVYENNEYLIGINGNWNALPDYLKKVDDNSYNVDINGDGQEDFLKIVKAKDDRYSEKYNVTLSAIIKSKEMVVEKISFYVDGNGQLQVIPIDLNGDGIMEIVTIASDDYFLSIEAFQLNGEKFESVLRHYDSE